MALPLARIPTLALTAALLPGCASPDPIGSLPLESAPPFTETGADPVRDRWWTAFDDPRLDERVDLALEGNFTLTAAWERISEARALAAFDRAALYPSVDGLADGTLREGSDVDPALYLILEDLVRLAGAGEGATTQPAPHCRADHAAS